MIDAFLQITKRSATIRYLSRDFRHFATRAADRNTWSLEYEWIGIMRVNELAFGPNSTFDVLILDLEWSRLIRSFLRIGIYSRIIAAMGTTVEKRHLQKYIRAGFKKKNVYDRCRYDGKQFWHRQMIRHNNIRHFDTTYCHRANNEHQRFILSSARVTSKHIFALWNGELRKHFIINDFASDMTAFFRLIFFLLVMRRHLVGKFFLVWAKDHLVYRIFLPLTPASWI